MAVKVVCLPFDGAAAQKHGRRKATDARFETMLGRSSWVDSLFVWFPASWMPLVVDAIREKSFAMRSLDASFSMNKRKIPGGWRILTRDRTALDPTAVETLPGLVCRANRGAVSESMDQYFVSPQT